METEYLMYLRSGTEFINYDSLVYVVTASAWTGGQCIWMQVRCQKTGTLLSVAAARRVERSGPGKPWRAL